MSGLLFLVIVALWLWALTWLVNKIGKRLTNRPWRLWAKLGIFVLLLPLPLIDEIVGGWQFKRLCEANVVRVDKEAARGRTVYKETGGYEMPVAGTWVKVWKLTTRYLDASTGEVVVAFDHLRAEGGHLFPGFDSGHDPLTFEGTCRPVGNPDKNFYTHLGLTRVDKPKVK